VKREVVNREAKVDRALTKPRALTISSERKGDVWVLHFAGDLDLKSLPLAKKTLGELIESSVPDAPKKARSKKEAASGPLQLVIDLENVDYIDSSGLGFFIGSLKRIKELKGNLKLARLNAYLMGIFRLINMHYIIEVYDDLNKAVNSMTSPRSAVAAAQGAIKE
jgi:stage II sporulation protein AA (anti-sigma F factor antagonist)